MAEMFPVSRGTYDPSFAFDTSDAAPVDISAFAPPPMKTFSPYPIGYNDATKQMYVNGETFDFDDHQSALDTREALKRPKQKMPDSFRPIEPDKYVEYINNIRDPSFGRKLSKNWAIGMDNLQLLAGYGLQLAGAEELGKEIADQQLKDLRKNQPYQRAFTDISVDKPGGIIDWFVANLAQQGPMLLESVLVAGAGALIGGATGGPAAAIGGLVAGLGGKAGFKSAALAAAKKRAAKQALTKAEKTLLGRVGGATLATAASNYAIGASDVYGEQLEGGTADRGTALALGIPYAVAETIPELIGAGLLFKGAKGGRLKRFGKGLALGSVGEGTTEFVQEVITASQNPNLSDEEKSLRYINAFAAGAGVGGTVTGLSLAARGEQRDTTATPTEEIADPEEVADPLAIEQEEQLELFPDQNLGAAPIGLQEGQVQGELFSDVRPVGPDGRPVDGEQLELDFSQEQGELSLLSPLGVDPVEEQRIQAEARERAALAAAERGDVAAFEQPDLFALEQEQEARRLGPIDVEQPEANLLDPSPVADPNQLDLPLTVASAQEVENQELQELMGTRRLTADQLLRRGRLLEQDAALRAESELETITGQLDTQQLQQTEERRSEILGEVLTNVTNRTPAGIVKKFARELRKAGITQTDPTESELRTIEAAANFAAAATAPLEQITPQATQTIDGQTVPRTAVPVVREQGERLRQRNAQERKAGANRTAKATGRKGQAGATAQEKRRAGAQAVRKAQKTQAGQDGSKKSGAAKLARGKQPASAKATGTGAAALKRGAARKKPTKADTEDKKKGQPAEQPVAQPTEREDQQPADVTVSPGLKDIATAWNTARRRINAGYRRSWSRLTAAKGSKNKNILAAIEAWKKAYAEYQKTLDSGNLYRALEGIFAGPLADQTALETYGEIVDSLSLLEMPGQRRDAYYDLLAHMLNSAVRKEVGALKGKDRDAAMQVFSPPMSLVTSEQDKSSFSEAFVQYLDDYLTEYKGNTVALTRSPLAQLIVTDPAQIGTVDLFLAAMQRHNKKVGKVPSQLQDKIDEFNVVAQVDIDLATREVMNKIDAIANSIIPGVGAGLDAINDQRIQIQNAIQYNKINLNQEYRGAPLKNWVDSKGMLKMKPTREGGKLFVIDAPKGAQPSTRELISDADAKPVEGRSATNDGAPITKPISMGVLRMERIKALKKFNAKARPSVKIYTSVEALRTADPTVYKEAMASRKDKKPIPTNASGYAYSTTDANGRIRYKILLFQEAIKDRQHARFIMAHEAIGHLGLRTIMSDQKFNSIMTEIYEKDPAIRREADQRIEFSGMKKLEAIEEAVADAAGTIESKLLERLKAAIKSFINKLFNRNIFTDDLTRYFIHQSKRYLRTGAVSDPSYAGIYDNMQELQRRHVEGRASADASIARTLSEQYAAIRPQRDSLERISDIVRSPVEELRQIAGISKGKALLRLLGMGVEYIQSLDNIALRSPGLQKLFNILDRQHEHIRDLQTKYRDLTAFAIQTRTVFNQNALDKTERTQVNDLLWRATLYKAQQLEAISDTSKPLYEQDIVISEDIKDGPKKGTRVNLVDIVDGTAVVNRHAVRELQKAGKVSKQQFKQGFAFKVFNDQGKVIETTNKTELAIDFEISDRVWKAYNEMRNVVDQNAVDVYVDKVQGLINTRNRHYDKLSKTFKLDGESENIIRNIGELYAGYSPADRSETGKGYAAIYQLIRVMHDQYGTRKMEDLFSNIEDVAEQDRVGIEELQTSEQGRALIKQVSALTKNKLSERQLKVLTRSLMDTVLLDAQVTNAELRAKQTIMGAYAPLRRRGRFQVRVTAYDMDGNPVRLDDSLRGMLTYMRTDSETDAKSMRDDINSILGEIKPGTRMLTNEPGARGNIDADGLVAVSRLEAVFEEASSVPPLGGTINYDDLSNTLMRAGVNLSAEDRRRLVRLTSSHHSVARRNLMRQGNPGFDTDMMRSIAEHIETGSHIAGKNRFQHEIAEILSDDTNWGGDFEKLRRLQDSYRVAVASNNEALIFDARKAMDQYQRMMVESSGRDVKVIAPIPGNPLNTTVIAGKGKGNRYRDQATNLVTYYRDTRNLVDASGEGKIGKAFRPVVGATAAAQLGGVLAPAIINMTSLYTHAIPYLSTYNEKTGYGGGHGLGASTYEIHRAGSHLSLLRDGFKQDVFGTSAAMDKLIAQAEKDPRVLDRYGVDLDELKFLRDLTAKGVLTPNLHNALLDLSRTGRRGLVGKGMETWMALFSKTEQYNRRVTALASYRLEKKRMQAQGGGVNQDSLYERATLAVNTSQGNYSQYNRPSWARGNFLQYTYMYKQFIVISVQLMRNLAPKERRVFLATLFLAAGLKGLPFGDDLLDLIDTLAQKFGIRWDGAEAELAQLADSIIPGSSAILLRGIIDAATGLTVSSRIGHGDLIPGTGMFKAGSNIGKEFESILGAPASFIVAAGTTASLATKYLAETVGLRDDTTTLADIGREGFGIAFVKAFTDGIVYMTSGDIINKRGQVVARDAHFLHSIARMTGFYPRKASLEYDVVRMGQQVSDYSKELAASLRHAYVKADAEGRRAILRDVRRLQRDYRGTPFGLKNFVQGARKSAKEADLTASQRSLRALPKAVKPLSASLAKAYGLD